MPFHFSSTSCLRNLHLANCWDITEKGLSQLVKKLPLLEEFDISINYISNDTIELIGRCCPLLKSLKISISMLSNFFGFNDHVMAIGKSMPGLRRLKITGNKLTNIGVFAILDGCSLLESLDL